MTKDVIKNLTAAGALLAPVGILIEQIIHLPYGSRHIFGEMIGNYSGDFTLGIAMQVCNIAIIGILRSRGANETTALRASAVAMGISLGLLIGIESFNIIGTPQIPDVIAALMGYVWLACGIHLYSLNPIGTDNHHFTG